MSMSAHADGLNYGSMKDSYASPFSWSGFYIGGTIGVGAPKSNKGELDCDNVTDILNQNAIANANKTCEKTFFDNVEVIDDHSPSFGQTLSGFELPQEDWIAQKGTSILENDGLLYGAIIGVNKQTGSHIIGIEADFSGAEGIEETSLTTFEHFGEGPTDLDEFLGTGEFAIKDELEWLSTLRMRFGRVLSDDGRFMGYVTGGVAFAQVSRTVSAAYDDTGRDTRDATKCKSGDCGFENVSGDDDFLQTGFVVGAGLSWAITDGIIIGGEYLYTDLGGGNPATSSARFEGDLDRGFSYQADEAGFDAIHQIRGRVVFKLN